MTLNPFQMLFSKKSLGIDIGTSFIKVVEISKSRNRLKLGNYGSLSAPVLYEKPFRTFEKSTLLFSSQNIARAILAIKEEAKIKNRKAIFSIPDFSTFFTNFELPSMTKEELSQAVRYEARQHVPLPLKEVVLDWQVTEGETLEQKKTKLKILLVAVPNEVINQYQEIARMAQLELVAMEAEVFGLLHSLINEDDRELICLIDIGARSTTCNIIDKKVLKISYSFDMSGNELTRLISKGLNIDYREAENLKKKHGILLNQTLNVRQILLPLIDVILREIEKIFNNFYQKGEGKIQKVILAGGSALIPGLKEYFAENLKKEVEIANPFSNIFYPPILEKTLKEMGPSYAIAVGMALRGLRY